MTLGEPGAALDAAAYAAAPSLIADLCTTHRQLAAQGALAGGAALTIHRRRTA